MRSNRTLVLIEEDVLDMEVVGVETALGGSNALVDVGQEDPSVGSSDRILEAFQQGSQGAIGCVAGFFAPIQEVVHRNSRH